MYYLEVFQRAQDCIAQGALTNSKHPENHVLGVYPTHLGHNPGSGAYLYDTDDNQYVDYICGLGTNLLGYGNGYVSEAVKAKIQCGQSHSLPTLFEIEAAESLKTMFVFVDRWKFQKNGSDACNSAIKIARAYKGVKNGNEGLLEMLTEEVCRRFSHEMLKNWQEASALQAMRSGVSEAAPGNGDKKGSPKKICKDRGGQDNRKELLENKISEGEGAREAAGLCGIQESIEEWLGQENAVRSLWVKKDDACPSRGLHQAVARELALSLASRGTSPRYLVLSDGYHGIGDAFISLTEPHDGVLKDLSILPLSGNEDLVKIAAAVIVEPVITDASDARREWLQKLRDECTKSDTVLIFDEIITSCRFQKHSVANAWNIYPDLILVAKAIANGFPLAAVGGKRKVMDGDYFVSSTYAGEILSLIACRSTVHLLMHNYQYSIERLWESGQNFIDKFNRMANPRIRLVGYPTRGVFEGSELDVALLRQEAAKAKILLHKTWFYNFPLMKEDYLFFTFLQEFVRNLEGGRLKLEGELPKSPFAQRVRDEKSKGSGRTKQGKRSGKTTT